MKSAERLRICVVGMEELPALTALRLREAGFAGAWAPPSPRGVDLWRAARLADVFHAVFPVYYFKWVPLLKAARKRVVFHWIGSDFYGLGRRNRMLFRVVHGGVDLHLADAPWLVQDLAKLGITAHFVPTVSEKMGGEVSPLPPRFRVLAYVPDQRRGFYGWEVVRMVARALPDIEVVAVGGAPAPDTPPNVRWAGYLDARGMEDVYRETSVLIRPTRQDGLSQMVLEALLRGRQVVWSKAFPHCRYAPKGEDFVAAVATFASRCELNLAGAAYVREGFTPAAASRALTAAYQDLVPS